MSSSVSLPARFYYIYVLLAVSSSLVGRCGMWEIFYVMNLITMLC